LTRQQKYAEAEPLLREDLTIRKQLQPDAWERFATQARLGACLLGQEKFADAEPHLLAGYEGLKQREARIPAAGRGALTYVAGWLVQLYEPGGKKDRADEGRKRLPPDYFEKPGKPGKG